MGIDGPKRSAPVPALIIPLSKSCTLSFSYLLFSFVQFGFLWNDSLLSWYELFSCCPTLAMYILFLCWMSARCFSFDEVCGQIRQNIWYYHTICEKVVQKVCMADTIVRMILLKTTRLKHYNRTKGTILQFIQSRTRCHTYASCLVYFRHDSNGEYFTSVSFRINRIWKVRRRQVFIEENECTCSLSSSNLRMLSWYG